MSQPQSVLITIAVGGTPQQGPNVPFVLSGVTAPTLSTASTNNAAGVTIGNSQANAAIGTGGALLPGATLPFPGLTNLNQLWFNGTTADKISGFGA